MKTLNLKKLIVTTLVLACAVGLLCLKPVYAGESPPYTFDVPNAEDDISLYVVYVFADSNYYLPDGMQLPAGAVGSSVTEDPNMSYLYTGTTYGVEQSTFYWNYICVLWRSYLAFDLSSLPDISDIIITATLSIYVTNWNEGEIKIYPGLWGGALDAEDWDSWSNTQLLGSANTANFSSGYNDIPITNHSTISTTGITKFALITSDDYGVPSGTTFTIDNNAVKSYSRDNGITNAPKLTITLATYPIFGYVRRPASAGGEGINGVKITISGGWLATPGAPDPQDIVLTTHNDMNGNAGYYTTDDTGYELLGGFTYTVEASNL